MLSGSFMLSFDKDVNMKETTASFTLTGMTVRTPSGGDLLLDLAAFGKEPEGVGNFVLVERSLVPGNDYDFLPDDVHRSRESVYQVICQFGGCVH